MMNMMNMMKHCVGLTLVASLALAAGCGKREPCSGGGNIVDDRPLPSALEKGGGLPPGAVACRSESMKPTEGRILFELGKNVDEGFEQASEHYFVKSGWSRTSAELDPRFRSVNLHKDGTTIKLGCSKQTEEPVGWCNMELSMP